MRRSHATTARPGKEESVSFHSRSSRHIVAVVLATLSLLLAMIASGSTAMAQDGEIGILLRSFACPNDAPVNEWEECDGIVGAVYRVEVDGVEIAESPVTTVRETGVAHGVFFQVPASGESITVTPLSGAPDGYAPAAGFDPFTANIADLPEVGMGGESSGPGIVLIYTPDGEDTGDDDSSTGDDDAASGDSSETSTLPRTGAGETAADASETTAPMALLLMAATLFGAGIVTRRQRSA